MLRGGTAGGLLGGQRRIHLSERPQRRGSVPVVSVFGRQELRADLRVDVLRRELEAEPGGDVLDGDGGGLALEGLESGRELDVGDGLALGRAGLLGLGRGIVQISPRQPRHLARPSGEVALGADADALVEAPAAGPIALTPVRVRRRVSNLQLASDASRAVRDRAEELAVHAPRHQVCLVRGALHDAVGLEPLVELRHGHRAVLLGELGALVVLSDVHAVVEVRLLLLLLLLRGATVRLGFGLGRLGLRLLLRRFLYGRRLRGCAKSSSESSSRTLRLSATIVRRAVREIGPF
mmetsp:Transcript_7107/g.28893  ORF Transcript_7107/g.28893 Transcript_7107/m.28893 type:complete len:293 (+) Transcript_7107:1293-2171(+)